MRIETSAAHRPACKGGMCRHHRFCADALHCIEPDCNIVPTATANKFVAGRCPMRDQRFRAAQKAAKKAGLTCSVGESCGVQNNLYEGLCRKRWNLRDTHGSFEIPVCLETDRSVTPETDPLLEPKLLGG